MIKNHNIDEVSVLWERWALLFEQEYDFCKEYGSEDYIDEEAGIYLSAPHVILNGKELSTLFDESFRWDDILDLIENVNVARCFLVHIASVVDRTLEAIERLYEVEGIVSDEYLDYADAVREEYVIAKKFLDYYNSDGKSENLSDESVESGLQQIYSIANGICIQTLSYQEFVDCIRRGSYVEEINCGEYFDPIINDDVKDIIYNEVGPTPISEHIFSFWISIWVCLCITTGDKQEVEIQVEGKDVPFGPEVNWVEASFYHKLSSQNTQVPDDDKMLLSSLVGRLTFEEIIHDINIQDCFSPELEEEEQDYYTRVKYFRTREGGGQMLGKILTLIHKETLYLEETCQTFCTFLCYNRINTDMIEDRRRHAQDTYKTNYGFIHRWYAKRLSDDEWESKTDICALLKKAESVRTYAFAVGYPVFTREMMHQYIERCIKRNYEFMNAIRNVMYLDANGLLPTCGTNSINREARQKANSRGYTDIYGNILPRQTTKLANMLVAEGYVSFDENSFDDETKKWCKDNISSAGKLVALENSVRREITDRLNFVTISESFNITPDKLRKAFINENKEIDKILVTTFLRKK